MAATRLSNREIARVFADIAGLLKIKGENRFRVLAYQRAAESIENLGRDVRRYWEEDRLQEIPYIGEAIADKIDELLRTGRLAYLEKLEAEYPRALTDLLHVPDLGPKRVHAVYTELGVTTLEELEAAATSGQLATLAGFGTKTQDKILAGIESLRSRSDRLLLGTAWARASALLEALREVAGDAIVHADVAGSLRRRCATIGDVDLLVASDDPERVAAAYRSLPQVDEVLLGGQTKTRIRLHTGEEADLRIVAPARWGTALQYFTGSQAHNVRIREIALAQNLSLSEYSFKRTDDEGEILCASEEEVYATLGLTWIPPELREDRGEIEAARDGTLPTLITVDDVRGDLHLHSTWSDGRLSIREMAEAARDRGYEYIVVTDHSRSLGMVGGLGIERLREQRREIDDVNASLDGITVLQGAEVEILTDGRLDYPDEVLAGLDVVLASLHTGLRQPREQVTSRLLAAIRNPHVDVIGHPSGRLLTHREGADLDLDAVLRAAAETGTLLEINGSQERLDLDPIYVREALQLGCRIVVNSDAHHSRDYGNMRYGIWQARRGWAEAGDVVNTYPLDEFLAYFRNRPDE